MHLVRLLIASLLAQSALGGDCPMVAPTSSFVAGVLRIPEASAKNARASIDPVLRKDRGVLWHHYYRILAEPAGSLMIAVLEAKYVPKPSDFGEDADGDSPPQRKFTESNGDICYISARKILSGRTEFVARLERKAGDWDVLLRYVTDDAAKLAQVGQFSDENLRSYLSKSAAELKRTEQ